MTHSWVATDAPRFVTLSRIESLFDRPVGNLLVGRRRAPLVLLSGVMTAPCKDTCVDDFADSGNDLVIN